MSKIIPGAETIDLKGEGSSAMLAGVLLLHGFGDSPHSLRYLAADLHNAGYGVRVPLLPGHGRDVQSFNSATAEDWIEFAASELKNMSRRYRSVAIGGLSMGGAISAVIAGREGSDLSALILIAPYLGMPLKLRLAAMCNPILRLFIRQVDSQSPLSVRDPVERANAVGYGVSTPDSVKQLWRVTRMGRAALPDVKAPTLIVQSREDNRIAASVAEDAFVALGTLEKKLVFTKGSGHVITVDYGREKVFAEVKTWLGAHVGTVGENYPPPLPTQVD